MAYTAANQMTQPRLVLNSMIKEEVKLFLKLLLLSGLKNNNLHVQNTDTFNQLWYADFGASNLNYIS